MPIVARFGSMVKIILKRHLLERPVSMLFQENNFYHLSVEENTALGLKPNLALNAEEKSTCWNAASAVNLQDF